MMRPLRIWATLAILLLGTFSLSAQNTASQESRRAALRKEIAQLEKQIKENQSRRDNALGELKLVRRQVATRRELVAESDREIRALADTISARQADAERLRKRLSTLEEHYRRLIRNAYKNRDARLWFTYLLSSRDIGQASRRYVYLRDLSATMNAQGRKLKEVRAALDEDLARLSALKKEAEEVRKARELELKDLRSEEERSDRLIANLKKDRDRYQKQLETKRKQVEADRKSVV